MKESRSGGSRLINADCLEEMDKLIAEGVKVDCIIADIPYDEVSKNGEERQKYAGVLRNIDKGKADILTFNLDDMCDKMDKLKFNSAWIFCGIEQIVPIMNRFKYDLKKDYMCRQMVWHKTNPSPANGQHMPVSSLENYIFIKRRKTKYYGHCEHNVVSFPTCRSKLHPTEKPQALLNHLIKLSTDENDVVLDFCFGSGSTGVACKNLNRNFIGIELSRDYYEIACKRIESILI